MAPLSTSARIFCAGRIPFPNASMSREISGKTFSEIGFVILPSVAEQGRTYSVATASIAVSPSARKRRWGTFPHEQSVSEGGLEAIVIDTIT